MKYILSLLIAFLFCCSTKTNAQSELLRRDVYDFEEGDSLYYKWAWDYSNSSTQYKDYLWIITDKSYNNDSSSVSYQYFEYIKSYAMYYPTSISSGYSNVTYPDLDSTYIEGFPFAYLFDSTVYSNLGIYEKMNYDSANIYWNVDSNFNSFGYAYYNNIWNSFNASYAKGLGITEKGEGREYDTQSKYTRLIGYHKANGKKWGTINTKNFISSVKEAVPSQLKIYPNPVSDILNIEQLELTASGIATIYSIDGLPVKKLVIEKGKNQIKLDDIATGIYILLIQTNEGIVQQRIVKF